MTTELRRRSQIVQASRASQVQLGTATCSHLQPDSTSMKSTIVLLICASVAAAAQEDSPQDSEEDTPGLRFGPHGTDYYKMAKNKVEFQLSTRNNPEGFETIHIAGIVENFNSSRPTKILIHGWNAKHDYPDKIRTAFLDVMDVNVVVVNWSKMDTLYYPSVVDKRMHAIARRVSDLIVMLHRSYGMKLEDLHLVGHNLGAHIAGLSSLYVTQGTLGRITGLDPVCTLIGDSPEDRLDKSHARFVDVIHTSGNVEGWRDPIGHVDFYPNGGKAIQPGCLLQDYIKYCSHNRAYELFRESILLKDTLVAVPSMAFKAGSWPCKKADKQGEKVVMGLHTPESARGVFCLATRKSYPYGYGTDAHHWV